MSALEQLALAWQALLHSFRLSLRGALWTPWLLQVAAQFAALLALWQFAHPALSWLVVPLFRLAGGEAVLHYPESLRQLPWLFAHADLTIALVLAPLVSGWALGAFGEAFGARAAGKGGAGSRAARRYGTLWLGSLPLFVVVVALALGLEGWAAQQKHGLLVRALEQLTVQGGLVVAQTLLFFVPASIMLGGNGVGEALREVPWAAGRAGWGALALTVFSNVAIQPFRVLTERAATGAGGAAPERVLAFLSLEILATAAISYLVAGGVTLLYLGAVAPPDEGLA